MITQNLGGITASTVGYALDGLALRQNAIAMNIANANSPGYRPLEVSFEQHLANHLAAGGNAEPMTLPAPAMQPAGGVIAAQNSVEMQTVQLNQTVLQYQALITGLNKYMATMQLAVNEGRR